MFRSVAPGQRPIVLVLFSHNPDSVVDWVWVVVVFLLLALAIAGMLALAGVVVRARQRRDGRRPSSRSGP